MPSPLALRALLLVLILPAAALADDDVVDDGPVTSPSAVPYAGPSATTVIVNVGVPAPAPIAAPAVVPVVAPVAPVAPVAVPIAGAHPYASPMIDDPCGGIHARGPWRHKLRGRFAVGFSAGKVANEDETSGRQRSLIARATGRRGFGLEVELARTTLGEDTAKTFGGALFKSFGKRKIAPYVIAGGGGGKLDLADGSEAHLKFAELGGGVMLRGRRISIGVDVRRGVRKVDAAELGPDAMPVEMTTIERTTTPDDDHGERYTRARIVALVTF